MSLATRCTSCGTIFRVVQDQLKVSEGWVRCGRCEQTFNALEGLFDLEREAPPPQLVKLRESIQAKGTKGVGMELGGLVLVIVVVALLLSGGSDNNTGNAAQPGDAPLTSEETALLKKEIKALKQQLNAPNVPKAQKKSLAKQIKRLEKEAGISSGGNGNAKNGKQGKSGEGKSSNQKKTTPDEEGS